MKVSFRNVDFDRLTEFWNEFYPARYRIDADLLRKHTVECPVFDWGASFVEEADGEILSFVIVKKAPATLYRTVDRDVAHLSAIGYCDANYGVDQLAELKRILKDRGCRKIVYGQDSLHFFPGCPDDFPALVGFLTVEGFELEGVVSDLERDLTDFENAYPVPEGDTIAPLGESEVSDLESFLEREFPGRWHYDVKSKVEAEGADCVVALRRDGKIEGFALVQDSRHRVPVGGAVWRNDLGENWGSLGPIGVSSGIRKQGSGMALLGEALAHLRDLGVKRCIIDWTGLVDFYKKQGFEETRRYRCMSLALE